MNPTRLRSVFHSSFSGEPIPDGSVRATVGNGITNNDRDLSSQVPGRDARECHEDVPTSKRSGCEHKSSNLSDLSRAPELGTSTAAGRRRDALLDNRDTVLARVGEGRVCQDGRIC
jgi:hypothetical protein